MSARWFPSHGIQLYCFWSPHPHIWLNSLTYQNVHALATSFAHWDLPDELIDHGICPHFWRHPLLVAPCLQTVLVMGFTLTWFYSLPDGPKPGDSGDHPLVAAVERDVQHPLQCRWKIWEFFMPDVWEVAFVTTGHSLNRFSWFGFSSSVQFERRTSKKRSTWKSVWWLSLSVF